MYSKTREDYDIKLQELYEDETVAKYPGFVTHIEDSYLGRSSQWALYVRNELQLKTHGLNTSNLVESSFRVLKDFIFNREKVSTMIA